MDGSVNLKSRKGNWGLNRTCGILSKLERRTCGP